MPEHASTDPLSDARAQAVRRILELRGEKPAADVVDLRALIARVDVRSGEVNAAAKELSAVLPTRVEAAIERVVTDNAAGVARRLDAVRSSTEETADAIARIEADLVAERLARIEDLEALVALVSGGVSAIRSDIARLNDRVAELAEQLEQPRDTRTLEPEPTQPPAGRHAYRSLFARTEPSAKSEAESTAEHPA
jgi:chromosome segregation ATPase